MSQLNVRKIFSLVMAAALFAAFLPGAAARAGDEPPTAPALTSTVYLPLVQLDNPWVSPYGVEALRSVADGSSVLARTVELNSGWIRLGKRVSWRLLQPNPGDPIQWDLLVNFENELRALRAAGVTPLVIVHDSPLWAVEPDALSNQGELLPCGAINSAYFDDFAAFMTQIVNHFKTDEFNVHNWELGNEVDVDPSLLDQDYGFGCWGDIDDDYYGGAHYGAFLNAVAPSVRSADSRAKIWIGGLLLDNPNTSDPKKGNPELFLEGVLIANAGDSFDIVPYHSYPPYMNERIDHDNAIDGPWDAWGGGYVGKATFLRQMMAEYNVNKPVVLNETGLMCPDYYSWCVSPDDGFYQMQADFLARSFVRALSANIGGVAWYTIDGPGWRFTSLLEDTSTPKPAYYAYKALIQRLQRAFYVGTVTYSSQIESYVFRKDHKRIHVLWTKEDINAEVLVPVAEFIKAYTRDGVEITPVLDVSNYRIPVGFSPIYIERNH
ncbi:MAG: hypothetical protein L0Z70_07860 [Chloroflexi bacterium]|nr:hypothetical protein [Chloroflexota bacterium]